MGFFIFNKSDLIKGIREPSGSSSFFGQLQSVQFLKVSWNPHLERLQVSATRTGPLTSGDHAHSPALHWFHLESRLACFSANRPLPRSLSSQLHCLETQVSAITWILGIRFVAFEGAATGGCQIHLLLSPSHINLSLQCAKISTKNHVYGNYITMATVKVSQVFLK